MGINISEYKLRQAINDIDIKPNKLNNLIGNMDDGKWESAAKDSIKAALDKVKANYTSLEKIKEKAKQISKLVDEYHDTEKKLNRKRTALNLLGKEDSLDKNARSNLESDISYLKGRLRTLENQINGSI